MSIEYRILHSNEEFEDAVNLEIKVWGLDPRDAVPTHIMRSASHDNGGVVIGAYDGERMVGMSFSFAARRENQWILWSHMTGVDPEYQGKGVGSGLKFKQREWALDNHYNVVGWTFDPMQRGNANFNMHHLGAIATIFHENLYGEMNDEINRGLQSDRLEATWILRDERATRLAAGEAPWLVVEEFTPERFLLSNVDGKPYINPNPVNDAPWHFVEIPYSLRKLKEANLAQAIEWQFALRHVLQDAFARGWVIVDFCVQEGRCWYILRGTPRYDSEVYLIGGDAQQE